MRRQARFQGFDPDQTAQTSDPFYGGGSTGTPEASIAWAQNEVDAGRPVSDKVFDVKEGRVSMKPAFSGKFTMSDYAPVLTAAGGVGIGALLGGGGAAASGGAMAGGNSATAGGLAASPGLAPLTTLPGTSIGTAGWAAGSPGLAPLTSLPGATIPTGASGLGAAAKGGGFVSNLLKDPDRLVGIGRSLGSLGQTQANNRGVALDAEMEADKMRMMQERNRMDDESHIWKMLQAANYMKSGGAPKGGPVMSASGKPFTSYDFGPRAINQADKDMATTLEAQLLKRLQTPPALRNYDKRLEPGKAEKASNWAGTAASIAGMLFGKR